MKKAFSILAIISTVIPTFALAQPIADIGGFVSLINMASNLISRLIPTIIALTVLVFLWGVFKLISSGGDGDARKEGLGYMWWGVVALFVMVSVWGLVNVLVRSFALNNTAPEPPRIPVAAPLNF